MEGGRVKNHGSYKLGIIITYVRPFPYRGWVGGLLGIFHPIPHIYSLTWVQTNREQGIAHRHR